MNKNVIIKILLIITLLVPSKIYAEGLNLTCDTEVYPGSEFSCTVFLEGINYEVSKFKSTVTLSGDEISVLSFSGGYEQYLNNNEIDTAYFYVKRDTDILGTFNLKVSVDAEPDDRYKLTLDNIRLYSDGGNTEHNLGSAYAMIKVKLGADPAPRDSEDPSPPVDPSPGEPQNPGGGEQPSSGDDQQTPSSGGDSQGSSGGGSSVTPTQPSGGSKSGGTPSDGNQGKASTNPGTGAMSIFAVAILMVVALYGAYHFFINSKKAND